MKRYFVTVADEDGVVVDRFQIINGNSPEGRSMINDVQPGEEDAETEVVGSTMSNASLINRLNIVVKH